MVGMDITKAINKLETDKNKLRERTENRILEVIDEYESIDISADMDILDSLCLIINTYTEEEYQFDKLLKFLYSCAPQEKYGPLKDAGLLE